jgi:Rrf2 family protein
VQNKLLLFSLIKSIISILVFLLYKIVKKQKMRFSTKTRYGMRAMAEIAKADQKIGIFQKDISKNQKISVKYLDHIIQALKANGLIVNIKGKKSGYRLTRAASEITMLQIHTAFEQEIAVIDCMSQHIDCELVNICHTYPFWSGLNKVVEDYFKGTTLVDLLGKGND